MSEDTYGHYGARREPSQHEFPSSPLSEHPELFPGLVILEVPSCPSHLPTGANLGVQQDPGILQRQKGPDVGACGGWAGVCREELRTDRGFSLCLGRVGLPCNFWNSH